MAGAIIGAMLCWATYKLQFDDHPEPENTLGIFSTAPQIPNTVWNLVTEVIDTFVQMTWILLSPVVTVGDGGTPNFGSAARGGAGGAGGGRGGGAARGGP